MVVNLTPVSLNSDAAHRANASSAALDATYAENRGALESTPIDEMLMTWPRRFFSIAGSTFMIMRRLPK